MKNALIHLSASVILAVLCLGQSAYGAPPPAAELLYRTGFGAGTKIVPIHPASPTSDDDLIDEANAAPHPELKGIKFAYEGGDQTMRYARIVEERGNPANKVLRFWANQANAKEFSKTRIQADVKGVKKGLKEISMSVRLYLPQDMALLKQYPLEITWLTIMEVWNNAPLRPFPFRVTVGLRKPAKGEGPLRFHVSAQDIDQTDPKKAKFTTLWSNLNEQVEAPIGKWMTLEYSITEGDARSGRFFMAVTPQGGARTVLFDVTHFTHHTQDPAPDGFTAWNPMKLYTSRQLADYMRGQGKALEMVWDDLSIWKGKAGTGQ